MDYADGVVAGGAQAVDNLKVATRVGGGDNDGLGRADVTDLSLLEPGGSCRLRDVIDAGTSAAPSGFSEFAEFVTWKRA